jgi:hypothetical protein
MARTLAQIQAQMDQEQAAQSSLAQLNSPSQTAIYTLWKYIVSLCIYLHEVLMDTKKAEIEDIVATSIVPSEAWLKSKVMEFQYDSVTPQVVVMVDYAPQYDPIDTTKRIITRCSVKTQGNRVVTVKVAKSEPPVALSAPELTALQGYLTQGGTNANDGTGIGYAGVQIVASSITADKLYIKATIYYDGQYAAVISDNVIAALEQFMADLPFDGVIKVVTLVNYLEAVTGFKDILVEELAIRAHATAFASRTSLITGSTQILTKATTFAGYIVEETTSGETFTDRLTFSAI